MKKTILLGLLFNFLGCTFFTPYSRALRPAAIHQNALIYRDGVPCVESKKTAEVTLCVTKPDITDDEGLFYIVVTNKGSVNLTYNPGAVLIQPMVGKKLSILSRETYIDFAKNQLRIATSGTPTPQSVQEANHTYSRRMDMSTKLLQLNTLKPNETISGNLAYEGKGFNANQTLDVTIPLGSETHQFSLVF